MTNTLIHGIIDALSGSVSKEVIVFLISMIPILELRGALLVAGPILGVKVSTAIPLCIIGNIIPVPFILLLITPVFKWMKGTKTFKPLVDKLENKAMSKKDQIEKYEFWGLVLFVGIPLPGTGAWTGSLIAALLGMKFKKAFPAVVIGICMATVIMWFISYVLLGGIHLLGTFYVTFLQNAIKRGFVGGEYHPNTNICEIVVSQYKIIRQVVVLFVIILSIITKFVNRQK